MRTIKAERDLAKLKGFDIWFEDHGIIAMAGTFHYEGSSCQGFGYCINIEFVKHLMSVFGVEYLQKINGKSCWVTHDHSSIYKLEPIHKEDGKVFDVQKWVDDTKKKSN